MSHLTNPEAAPLAKPLSFSIPVADMMEYSALASARRAEIQLDLKLIKRAHAIRLQGRGTWVADTNGLASLYSSIRGVSGSSIRRKYQQYVDAKGDWRILVKDYHSNQRQPEEFIEYIRALTELNPRSVSAALKVFLYKTWPAGAHIPGIGTWQEWFKSTYPKEPLPQHCPRRFPMGWTVRNLSRFAASRVERKLFGIGYKAAHGDMPALLRDTSKLLPMQMITIDDFEIDHLCVFEGDPVRKIAPQVAPVGGLIAIDVATRKRLAKVIGPMVERPVAQSDGTTKMVRSHITKLDVLALLYLVFKTHGLPDHEVLIVCENATATISPDSEYMLSLISGGRIKVQRTSMIHHKTLSNGFPERGGTPWQKGWIEAGIGYQHNLMAATPGWKGSNERLNGPGSLPKTREYALRLLGQGADKLDLPASVKAEIGHPFQNVEQLDQAVDGATEIIENYPHHKMGGFEDVTEFLWPDANIPAPAGIDPVHPNNFYALGNCTKEEQMMMIPKTRKETIIERWTRLTAADPRSELPTEVLSLFMLQPKRAMYRNRHISISHAGVGYSYIDASGSVLAGVLDKTPVLLYIDFDRPQVALVTDAKGNRLGLVELLGNGSKGVDITDHAAVLAARQARAAWLDDTVAKIQSRPLHQEADAAQEAILARNAELIAPYEPKKLRAPEAQAIAAGMEDVHEAKAKQLSRAKVLSKAKGIPVID